MPNFESLENSSQLKGQDLSIKECFECGTPHPGWASVSYGIYLCLHCSGIHRSLGVNISYVRSITMDKWDNFQQKQMLMGGNQNLRDFFLQHEVMDMPVTTRYHTKAAAYYRKFLYNTVRDLPLPVALEPNEGKQLSMPNVNPNWEANITSTSSPQVHKNYFYYHDGHEMNNNQSLNDGRNKKIWNDDINNKFSDIYKSAKDIKDMTVSTVREHGVYDSAKSLFLTSSYWLTEKTKKMKDNFNDDEWWKTKQNQVTEKANYVQDKLSSVAGEAATQTSGFLEKAYSEGKNSNIWKRLSSFNKQN